MGAIGYDKLELNRDAKSVLLQKCRLPSLEERCCGSVGGVHGHVVVSARRRFIPLPSCPRRRRRLVDRRVESVSCLGNRTRR